MSISIVTAMRILGDPELYTATYGPTDGGTYGFAICSYDETPSGCKRPQLLGTSEPIYETEEAAKAEAEKLVASIRELEGLP